MNETLYLKFQVEAHLGLKKKVYHLGIMLKSILAQFGYCTPKAKMHWNYDCLRLA